MSLKAKLQVMVRASSLEPNGEKIHLEIPTKCPVKARPRRVQKGYKIWWYTPSSKAEADFGMEASKIMRENGWKPLAERVKLSCIVYLRGNRRSDFDNFLKAIADSLEGICYFNDFQVCSGHIEVIDRASKNFIIVDLEGIGEFKKAKK